MGLKQRIRHISSFEGQPKKKKAENKLTRSTPMVQLSLSRYNDRSDCIKPNQQLSYQQTNSNPPGNSLSTESGIDGETSRNAGDQICRDFLNAHPLVRHVTADKPLAGGYVPRHGMLMLMRTQFVVGCSRQLNPSRSLWS